MPSIADRVAAFTDRIQVLAARWGRDPGEITIVAVSKTFPAPAVDEVVRAGIRDVGENRVQELLEKMERVAEPCRWHLVGHLQTNKVKHVVGRVALIHSLDSIKLARHLETAAAARGTEADVLLQVNTSGEESKFGVEPEAAVETAAQVASCEHLSLRGFMTIGPLTDVRGEMTRSFALLRLLRDRYNDQVPEGERARHLSMGMSGDHEMAIAEGATLLRIGTALFGPRD